MSQEVLWETVPKRLGLRPRLWVGAARVEWQTKQKGWATAEGYPTRLQRAGGGRDPRRQNLRKRTGRGCLSGVSVRGSSQSRTRGQGTLVRLRFRMCPASPRGGLRRCEPGKCIGVMGEPCLKEGTGLRDAAVRGRTWYIGIIRQLPRGTSFPHV